MKNNILSNEEILAIVNKAPDNFTQVFRSKKNSLLYGNTYDFINHSYTGDKFSEKLYKHIHGERICKKCQTPLTSKQFRSFFKSPWIWNLNKTLNLQKINAVKSQGFEIDVVLFNSKGKLLETYA